MTGPALTRVYFQPSRHLSTAGLLACRPYGAFWISALSVLESMVTAKSGMTYGQFYQAFVDRDLALFKKTLLWAVLLYSASACIAATTDFVCELLSVRCVRYSAGSLAGRRSTAGHNSCGRSVLVFVCRTRRRGRTLTAESRPVSACCRWRWKLASATQRRYCRGRWGLVVGKALDTPDQRMTQDTAQLTEYLGKVAKVLFAAPLKVAWVSVS